MRVLFQSRPDLLRLPAGDTIQVMETMRALRELGVEVDHCMELNPDLSGYDLVHLFNISRAVETYAQCRNAVERGRPVVVSPIYWNMEEYILNEESDRSQRLVEWWRKDNAFRLQILKWADMVLPNGWAEMNLIHRDFGIRPNYMIVPNGADPAFANADPIPFVSTYGLEDIVLCVGRISPRKNQLRLIKALSGIGIDVVLIGAVNDPFYFEKCREHAGANIKFLPQMPQSQLASAYAAAKAHVLPSWYDTPGLVSLEAAMAGCNIVSTNRGTAAEYFGNLAWYCDPRDVESIREAALRAYSSERVGKLKEIILTQFTWEVAARETLKAYEMVLA
ncbi:MAG TPA: glycosyltransferase family 4 protein [Firmicutes bacterium]|nr:glycosyltransferase family 4 protein [Bacillota bacterium]